MNRRDFIKNTTITGAAALGCGAVAGLLSGADTGTGANAAMELPLRPPGAVPEDEFLARCIRCLRCVDACPNQAIRPLSSAFGKQRETTPAIKARRQACMLCNRVDTDYLKCGEACPTGAITRIRRDADEISDKVAMGIARIYTELCYSYNQWSCGACYRAFPFPGKAMTLGLWERPEIHAESCVGCGLCERACIRYPQAIRIKVAAADTRPGRGA